VDGDAALADAALPPGADRRADPEIYLYLVPDKLVHIFSCKFHGAKLALQCWHSVQLLLMLHNLMYSCAQCTL
jgi:hypothetical protein